MTQTFKTFFEKAVIGLIENMTLHEVGDVEAKVDSGNGAYNVLHGVDITVQGNKVSFTTVGNKRVVKDIIDTITINVGAGNTEERPVVNFRITFGGVEFDNIPFSIGDRETNEYKILVGKEFIKELDALIDVDAEYIADQQVEVN
mgnify:CR=1 FL=1|tara:strand:+ start:161 stop:595 length:435 start_codon:yes stop_codon:yes gene_type:complete